MRVQSYAKKYDQQNVLPQKCSFLLIFVLFSALCAIFVAIMLVKTDAIALRTLRYSDNKVIVDMLTRDKGRQSAIATMSKRRGHLRQQLLQPLSLLAVTVDVHPKARLHRLVDASIKEPYLSIPYNAYKSAIALFIADFLCHTLRGEQRDDPLYLYIEDSLRWLDGSGDDGFANFHLVFLMRLSRFLGFYPNLNDYNDGDVFDMRSGCFCAKIPPHADILAPREARLAMTMMRMNYQTMHLFRLNRTERNQLLNIVLHYYAVHIPDMPQLKSPTVLRELFS